MQHALALLAAMLLHQPTAGYTALAAARPAPSGAARTPRASCCAGQSTTLAVALGAATAKARASGTALDWEVVDELKSRLFRETEVHAPQIDEFCELHPTEHRCLSHAVRIKAIRQATRSLPVAAARRAAQRIMQAACIIIPGTDVADDTAGA